MLTNNMICSQCERLGKYTCCLNSSFCKKHLIVHLSDKSKIHNIKNSESLENASNTILDLLQKLSTLKKSISKESLIMIERIKENTKNLQDFIEKEVTRLTEILKISTQNFDLSSLTKAKCRYRLENKFDSSEIINSIDKHFSSFLRENKILEKKTKKQLDQNNYRETTENLLNYKEKKKIKKKFLNDHSFRIFDIAISPKGDKLALVDMIKVIRIIKIPNNNQENVFEISHPVFDLKFTFDGKFLVMCEILSITLVNLESNVKKLIVTLTSCNSTFAVHSNSYVLGYYKNTNKIILINFEKETKVLEETNCSNYDESRLVFLNNSDEYAYSCNSKLVIKKIGQNSENSWNCESGNIISFEFSADDSMIILLSYLDIFIINKQSLNVIKKAPFKSDPKCLRTRLFIIKDLLIIQNYSKSIFIFDFESCFLIDEIKILSFSIAISHTKDSFYYNEESKIMKYNLRDSSRNTIIEYKPCNLEITKQNISKSILAYSESYQAIIYDINLNKITKKLPAHDKPIKSICIFEPKSILFTAYDNKVTVWDYSISKQLKTFNSHLNEVYKVVISYNGLYAASVSEDSLVFYSILKLSVVKIVKIKFLLPKIKFSHCDRFFICSNLFHDARIFKVPEFNAESLYFNKDGPILYSGISYDLAYFVMIDANSVAKIWDRIQKCKYGDFKTLQSCKEWCEFYPEFKKPFEKYMIR